MELPEGLTQFIFGGLVLGIMIALVYGLTWLLRFRYQAYAFPHPKRTALWALAAIVVGWGLIFILFILVTNSQAGSQNTSTGEEYTAGRALAQWILDLIMLAPAAVAMWRLSEPLASIGISGHNLGRSILTGMLFSIIVIATSLPPSDLITSLGNMTIDHFWAFTTFLPVGFGEELLYRGYLQTRLIAWLGKGWGWVLASTLMALMHFVQRITVMGMSPLEALVNCLTLIPVSLFLGYLMIRTENVVAPALVHVFMDWVGTLIT